jgi:hypothetical protein
MLCYCCGKQKNELQPCQSDIIKGMSMFMCQSCIDAKMEPRYVVVLGGRQHGPDHVRDYIIKRRYVGRPISAEELIA